MKVYARHILAHLINCACSANPIMTQREKVVPQAVGTALEIGIGRAQATLLRRQAGDDKSAGQPIWTTADRPKRGALGGAPSIQMVRS